MHEQQVKPDLTLADINEAIPVRDVLVLTPVDSGEQVYFIPKRQRLVEFSGQGEYRIIGEERDSGESLTLILEVVNYTVTKGCRVYSTHM